MFGGGRVVFVYTDVVSDKDRQSLFIHKLGLCKERLNFADARLEFRQKELKRRTLVELVDYVNSASGMFTPEVYGPLVDMVSTNLFRALPLSTSGEDSNDPEDDDPQLEPAWQHIQIVYELFRRFIVSHETDPRIAREYINETFILQLLDLFDSEDPREREYLKNILHRIYGKIMPLRQFIRKSITYVFHHYVYEVQNFNGVAELLEILGSVINGFALPLKEEHKQFLRKSLIPLHIPRGLTSYHVQLSFCVTQFVEKDASLAVDVIRGLCKYWPASYSRKEVSVYPTPPRKEPSTPTTSDRKTLWLSPSTLASIPSGAIPSRIPLGYRAPVRQSTWLNPNGFFKPTGRFLDCNPVTAAFSSLTSFSLPLRRLPVRLWPYAVVSLLVQVMFLNELEELLELVDPEEVSTILEMMFKKITACIESQHFQVAERALFFWNNEYIVNLIVHHREVVVPIVFPALQRNAEGHWNRNVHSLSYNVQKLLAEMDPGLFEDCAIEYERQQRIRESEERQRRERWAVLERRVNSRQLSTTSATLRAENGEHHRNEESITNNEAAGRLLTTSDGAYSDESTDESPSLTLTTAKLKDLQATGNNNNSNNNNVHADTTRYSTTR